MMPIKQPEEQVTLIKKKISKELKPWKRAETRHKYRIKNPHHDPTKWILKWLKIFKYMVKFATITSYKTKKQNYSWSK